MESGEGNKPQDAEDITDAYKPNVLGKAEVPPPFQDPHADVVRRAVSGDFDEEAERRRLRDVDIETDRLEQRTDEHGNLPPMGSAEWNFGYSLNPQENSSSRSSSEGAKPRGPLDALKRLLGVADKEIKPFETRQTVDDSLGRSQAGLEEFQKGMIEKMKSSSADSEPGGTSDPQAPSTK